MGGGIPGALVAAQEVLNRRLSFGAEVLKQGGVRFRLWAPSAKTTQLVTAEREMPMRRLADGWFEVVDRDAHAGSLYQYAIDGKQLVPDPASRFQPRDVDGPSEVVDLTRYPWKDAGWKNRPWREAVIYELHVGTFSSSGNYAGVMAELDTLRESGITAIELMPLSDFAGKRNWGYDGVLPYAPDSAYGRPEELEALVEAAHQAGLMVFLDVVYNHFGPKGNYLNLYAPEFFNPKVNTPWGPAINFENEVVRQYFIQNVLYWLNDYHFDGLRFDAVHAIHDPSPRHILDEIRAAVPAGKHLVLENDANQARFIGPGKYEAQWNDDSHHCYHVLATGEADGYYVAYEKNTAERLARCLAEGFAYQGETSPFSKEPRGEKSGHLPPTCFVDFLQNHDQIGNRALGERLTQLADAGVLRALTAIQLLAPSPPLIFMGEEWGCRQPFLFFCDFEGELGESVRKGRREEFSRFKGFKGELPDPLAQGTFAGCVLDRSKADQVWAAHYKQLLGLRSREVVPLNCGPGTYRMLGERAFEVTWHRLTLIANLGDQAVEIKDAPAAKPLWGSGAVGAPWSVHWWKQ
jgi:maltooligosyltrehalose trehalohydrolase